MGDAILYEIVWILKISSGFLPVTLLVKVNCTVSKQKLVQSITQLKVYYLVY